jgi:hypothetical protein
MYDLIESELRVYAKTHGATLVEPKGKSIDLAKIKRGRKLSRKVPLFLLLHRRGIHADVDQRAE